MASWDPRAPSKAAKEEMEVTIACCLLACLLGIGAKAAAEAMREQAGEKIIILVRTRRVYAVQYSKWIFS